MTDRFSITWTPEVRAFYVTELGDTSARVRTSFDDNRVRQVRFDAYSGNTGRQSARIGLGVNAQLRHWLHFRLDYDHEIFDHTSVNELGVSLGVRF